MRNQTLEEAVRSVLNEKKSRYIINSKKNSDGWFWVTVYDIDTTKVVDIIEDRSEVGAVAIASEKYNIIGVMVNKGFPGSERIGNFWMIVGDALGLAEIAEIGRLG